MHMAVGQNSIKRAASSGNTKAKSTGAAKTSEKVAASSVIAAPAAETGTLFVDQEDGINAHYDINHPLPTFLL